MDALVERISEIFCPYIPDIEKIHLSMAPVEAVVKLDTWLQMIAPGEQLWQPEMLPRLLADLSTWTVRAVYGRGPNWVYAALAAQVSAQNFFQFAAPLGWVTPLPLQISMQENPEIQTRLSERDDATILEVRVVSKYLDYSQSDDLPFPPVSRERGLILNGRIPQWLLTSLVYLYQAHGVPWIGFNYPPRHVAVVMWSRASTYLPGDTVPMPVTGIPPIIP